MPLLAEVAIAVGLGYLLGSIPCAYLAGRLLNKGDIRHLGDGNVGAENAARELGPRIGIAVGIVDIAKGAMAVGLTSSAGLTEGAALASGVAAVLGHNWPLFLQFKGGRGAATTAGALLIALFPVSLISGAVAALATLAGLGTGTPGPLRGGRRGAGDGAFSGMLFGAVMFIPLPLLAWTLGYPVHSILYAMGLPAFVGVVHFYQVVLPYHQRTGRLSLRARD